MRFGDAGCDRANARFRDQLDADPRARIGIFQIEDQLRQILDRINVVMGRWRYQRYARRRVARLGDDLVDLVTGQLAALSGFGALRDLDLELVGVDQVIRGDAEARARHLFDRAAPEIAVRIALVAFLALAALAGVRAAAD